MAKSQAVTVKRSVRLINWRRRIGCRKSRPNPINSPPVKKFLLLEEAEDEIQVQDEGDFCQNWGPFISLHRNYEKKVAELEEELKQAKAETSFWFWKAEKLDSHLQNLLLQQETATTAQNAEEGFGESDEATSGYSSNGQSRINKWQCTCSICAENEAHVVVIPCNHLCLCIDCAREADTCPVCDACKTDCLIVLTC